MTAAAYSTSADSGKITNEARNASAAAEQLEIRFHVAPHRNGTDSVIRSAIISYHQIRAVIIAIFLARILITKRADRGLAERRYKTIIRNSYFCGRDIRAACALEI